MNISKFCNPWVDVFLVYHSLHPLPQPRMISNFAQKFSNFAKNRCLCKMNKAKDMFLLLFLLSSYVLKKNEFLLNFEWKMQHFLPKYRTFSVFSTTLSNGGLFQQIFFWFKIQNFHNCQEKITPVSKFYSLKFNFIIS